MAWTIRRGDDLRCRCASARAHHADGESNTGGHPVKRERHSGDARAGDKDVLRRAAEALCPTFTGHQHGSRHALGTGARISRSTMNHHTLGDASVWPRGAALRRRLVPPAQDARRTLQRRILEPPSPAGRGRAATRPCRFRRQRPLH